MYNIFSYMYNNFKHKNTPCTKSALLLRFFGQKSTLFLRFSYDARLVLHKAHRLAPRCASRLSAPQARFLKPRIRVKKRVKTCLFKKTTYKISIRLIPTNPD